MRPRVVVDDWKHCTHSEYRRLGMYHLVDLAGDFSNLGGAAGVLVHPGLAEGFQNICSRLTPGAFLIVVHPDDDLLQFYRQCRREGRYRPHLPIIVSTYDQMTRFAISLFDQALNFANRPSQQQPI